MPEEPRYFTVDEANQVLPAVRVFMERIQGHRAALAEAQAAQGVLLERIAGNGGDLSPPDVAEAQVKVEDEAAAVARCIEGIHELGGLVKDLDAGLVDFLAKRAGQDVLLCWRLGEEEITHWHGLDEGFAGRKPI
jgi:hypothetical protein